MTASGRGNGLAAEAWTPVADLDPQLADAMLAALRDAGVAAYAEPSRGSQGAYLEVRLPDRPTDRLYVDAHATTAARDVLLDHLPTLRAALEADARATTPSTAVDDAAWAEIVAAYDAPAADPVPRWPVNEDVDEAAASEGGAAGLPDVGERRGGRILRPAVRRPPHEPAGAGEEGAGWPAPPPDDPEDHFVPPEPPPLPEGDAISRFAWLGVIGGPVAYLVMTLLRWEITGWLALVPLAAFAAGFITLVARMRDRPGDGHGPDDGAVV